MRQTSGQGRRSRKKAAGESERSPYQVLEIPVTATAEEVRGAYLAKVREHPPEREPDGFRAVQRAYAALKDAARRKALDLSLPRKRLDPGWEPPASVDCGALFRERVFLMLLASSDLYLRDFSRFYANVDREIEDLS